MRIQWPTVVVAAVFLVVATVVAIAGPEEHRGVAVQAVLSTGLVISAVMDRAFPRKDPK